MKTYSQPRQAYEYAPLRECLSPYDPRPDYGTQVTRRCYAGYELQRWSVGSLKYLVLAFRRFCPLPLTSCCFFPTVQVCDIVSCYAFLGCSFGRHASSSNTMYHSDLSPSFASRIHELSFHQLVGGLSLQWKGSTVTISMNLYQQHHLSA